MNMTRSSWSSTFECPEWSPSCWRLTLCSTGDASRRSPPAFDVAIQPTAHPQTSPHLYSHFLWACFKAFQCSAIFRAFTTRSCCALWPSKDWIPLTPGSNRCSRGDAFAREFAKGFGERSSWMWTTNLLVEGVPSFRVSRHVASSHSNVPERAELVGFRIWRVCAYAQPGLS